jgi:tetratricopeptide (TPR) repeat protein
MRDPSSARLKRRAAEFEQKRQFDRAIETYIEFLQACGSELEDEDVALYNRVGDLLARRGDVSQALAYYERAVDLYAERGYLSSAIALCSKILRQSPGRVPVYYKLGRINARKGFRTDARKNFLEYAERMQQAGEHEEAFRALKEYASLYPDDEEMRLFLADLLSRQNRKGEALEQLRELYEKLQSEGRQMEARATVERMRAIDPSAVPLGSAAGIGTDTGGLVFLDVGEKSEPTPVIPQSMSQRSSPARLPGLAGLRVTFIPDDVVPGAVASWQAGEITPSSENSMPPAAKEPVPPSAVGSVAATGAQAETERGEASPAGAGGFPEEDSIPRGSRLAPLLDSPPLSGSEFASLELVEIKRASPVRHDLALPTTLPRLTPERAHTLDATLHSTGDISDLAVGGADVLAAELGLEADAASSAAQTAERPLEAALPHGFEELVERLPDLPPRDSARRESNEAPTVRVHTPRTALRVEHLEGELRGLLAKDPENPDLHRQLGELLLDIGKRELGLDTLALALGYYERDGRLDMACRIARELVRVAPDVVKYHRKRAELAVQARDKGELVEAYMDLATAFFKSGEAAKAVSVYLRVLELDPEHGAALFALRTLDPTQLQSLRGGKPQLARWSQELEAIPEGPPKDAHREPSAAWDPAASASGLERGEPDNTSGEGPSSGGEQHTLEREATEETGLARGEGAAGDARPTLGAPDGLAAKLGFPDPGSTLGHTGMSTPAPSEAIDYVDLGEWLRRDEPPRSTRMVAQERAPSGDEEADFTEILQRFKRAVQQNLDVEDHEAHYDLGVAYKEMGLLDEAIAEFQKALRGSQQVRAYEALGQCFVEKGQFAIAAALLQRALEGSGADDQRLVGVLYLLGFAAEQMGRIGDALRYYQRVFAVDIEFRDVAQRIQAMEQKLS